MILVGGKYYLYSKEDAQLHIVSAQQLCLKGTLVCKDDKEEALLFLLSIKVASV